MPTPFYHLSIAEELLTVGKLPEDTRRCLLRQRPAFLLGNTAPDVQTVSQQPRQATHFFTLPQEANAQLPWLAFWDAYPKLQQLSHWPEAQAAFLAGYVCHLQADWLWANNIFVPIFGLDAGWGERQERHYIHNVLRAAIDRQVLQQFDTQIGKTLGQAAPQNWLPFVNDAHLCQWRDFLAQQLHPGAASQTVEVFAARQGIPVEAYYQLLDSERLMEQQVFSHFSRKQIEAYRQQVIAESTSLLAHWLPGCPTTGQPSRHRYTGAIHAERA